MYNRWTDAVEKARMEDSERVPERRLARSDILIIAVYRKQYSTESASLYAEKKFFSFLI